MNLTTFAIKIFVSNFLEIKFYYWQVAKSVLTICHKRKNCYDKVILMTVAFVTNSFVLMANCYKFKICNDSCVFWNFFQTKLFAYKKLIV